ncbi:hypothetical protein DSO57_1036215 [Entomophthora muscae]|uniref:Uncharacterized protein n=1 Tax=Entomophthora muscae TaxID=34485 RepID=A0ACC2U8U3_9FUNG|nr:hypothetical protein DSO57_1036215 [Entomophthora muscae]
MYMCLNISIALNLNLTILCSKRPSWKWERLYWAVSLVLPLLLDVPLLVFGIFGRNADRMCSFKKGSLLNDTFKLVYYAVFSSLTILYCFTISVAVVYKVRSKISSSTKNVLTDPPKLAEGQSSLLSLKSLIRRTCLYPVSCFLTYFVANMGIGYKYIHGTLPPPFFYWSTFGTNSRGILHILSFLADPLVSKEMLNLFRPTSSAPNPSNLMFYQFESSPDCNYSYNNLAGFFESNDIPHSYSKMVKVFQNYL